MHQLFVVKSTMIVNQYGRTFTNGRPLPDDLRVDILQMAIRGIRPCEISRGLQVTLTTPIGCLLMDHESWYMLVI